MWSKLKSLFSSLPRIPISKRNRLFITADIKTGVVVVSYKRALAQGKFDDSTIRNMVKGVRFEKSATDFFMSLAELIKQVTKQ